MAIQSFVFQTVLFTMSYLLDNFFKNSYVGAYLKILKINLELVLSSVIKIIILRTNVF